MSGFSKKFRASMILSYILSVNQLELLYFISTNSIINLEDFIAKWNM